MTQEDFDKYQENYRQVVINDLVSNKHDLPQAIYEYVKGSVLEKKREIWPRRSVLAIIKALMT